ncbi:hypothetical protein Tco_0344553, partial [Tanacetum coccineum]
VEDTVEPEDETVHASVHKVGESSTTSFHREDNDGLFPGFIRKDINSLFVRSSVEEGAAAMENLVRKLGNAEERNECKKLKNELEEARIMPPKSAPLTQAAVRRMIKESVDAAIAAKRARQANVGNNASGSGQARGAIELRRWFDKTKITFGISESAQDKKVKFAAATLRGPTLIWWNSKVAILGLDVANQMGWTEMKKLMTAEFCPAEELFDVSQNGRAEKCKNQCLHPRNERILEGNKQKWENFQSGNSSGKSNHKDISRQSSQNNQKQGNARAMTTTPNKGKVSSVSLPVCERCFTRHVGPCTIKCHKYGKIGHKARYGKEKNVFMDANAQSI